MELINAITTYCNSNPVIAGLVGLWGLTVLTFFVKTIPSKLMTLIKKHLTTTIYLYNYTYAYHQFMKWIDDKDMVKKFRAVSIISGRYGDEEEHTKGVGYGKHVIFLKGRPLIIELEEKESDSYMEKNVLRITKLGRSHKFFNDILKEINVKDNSIIKVYKDAESNWVFNKKQRKSYIENVCLEKEKKALLFNTIKKFIVKEKWYLEKGIPHRLGILLHGPPGVGKTILIKTVASYFNKNIYNMTRIDTSLLTEVPDNSIVLIEDIDSVSVDVSKRKNNKENGEEMKALRNIFGFSLSSLLNAIDGITDDVGKILFVTTNDIDKLDAALLRPGRIDLKLELGYVNDEIARHLFDKFFPNYKLPEGELIVRDALTPAKFQNLVMAGKSPDEILAYMEKQPIPRKKVSIVGREEI